MKNHVVHCTVALVLALVQAASLSAASGAPRALVGVVTDAETGAPLHGVAVSILGTSAREQTSFEGRFEFPGVGEGPHTLVFTRIGYEDLELDVEVGPETVEPLRVSMRESPVFLDQVVVTAFRREDEQRASAATLNSVSRADIEERELETLSQALDLLPSIDTSPNVVSIRGSQGLARDQPSRTLLLIDGIPFHPADNIGLAPDMIPVGIIDRVEVLKGPGSALYGPAAMAGVINVITREPAGDPRTSIDVFSGVYDQPAERQWRVGAESNSLYGVSLSHGRSLGEHTSGFLALRRDDTEGYQSNNPADRSFIYGGATYNRGPSHLRVTGGYTDQEHVEFLNWLDADHPYVEGNFPPEWEWRIAKNRYLAGLTWTQQASADSYYTVRGRYFRTALDEDFVNTADDRQSFGFQDSISYLYGLEVQGSWLVGDSSVIAGLDYQTDAIRSDSFGDHDGDAYAGYVQVAHDLLSTVRVNAGVRYDADQEDDLDRIEEPTFNGGVIVDLGGRGVVRLSYGEGFLLPGLVRFIQEQQVTDTVIIRPNPGLSPETSRSVELGYSWNRGASLYLNAAYFYTWFDNLIQHVAFREGDFLVETEENVAEGTLKGVDLELRGRRSLAEGRHLQAVVGYGYLDTWDKEERHPLDYRARHNLRLGASLGGQIFRGGLDYLYRSEYEYTPPPSFPDSDLSIDSRELNGFLGIDLHGYGVTLTVGNILQDRYLIRAGLQGPPRYFKLSLRFTR